MSSAWSLNNPFYELNEIAAWWSLRPRDLGKGYDGFHLSVTARGARHPAPGWIPGPPEHFSGDTMEEVIEKAVVFCLSKLPVHSDVEQPGKIAPRKRTVKRQ